MPGQETRYSIEGVEIFAPGEWNGDKYTLDDLDEMVKAFSEMSETFKPPLKLGHSEEQKILQDDGLPAAGWVGKLYRQGERLLADFVDIPQKVYDLIRKGAYRKVSSEIFWNIECGEGKSYKRMLAAVSLLGADIPAVMILRDILANYALQYKSVGALKSYSAQIPNHESFGTPRESERGAAMPEAEKEKIEAVEAELKSYKTKAEEAEKTAKESETKLKEYAAKIAEFEAREKENALNSEVEKLTSEKLIPVSAKEYAKAVLGEDKKEYSIGQDKLGRSEVLKKLLSLVKESYANTTENTVDGGKIPQNADEDGKIKKYMADNDVGYTVAYKEIMSGRAKTEGGK